jgi:hypothetical protein
MDWTTRRATLCLCALLPLSACVHWPDVTTDCAPYGVAENHQPLGQHVIAKAVYRDELDARCVGTGNAHLRVRADSTVVGCVVPYPDGTVYAYYWAGDRCAMNHELCHAIHGTEHTQSYLDDLASGVAAPYCPRNPFRSRASAG